MTEAVQPRPTVRAARPPPAAEGFDATGAGRDLFFAAVAATCMPMVVTDPRQADNPIVFANAAFLEMTGYAAADVLGRNCRFLQGPDTDRPTVALVRERLAQQREVSVELLNYRKDGSTFWNALYLTPVRNPAGELVYYYSSQLDISRRKDAESALSQAQKMEALGQLTGGIAHDFNNLLQVIVGNLEVIQRRLHGAGIEDPLLHKGCTTAREAARKSARLTQQLLAFARKQELQGRVLNLNDLLRSLLDMASRSLGDGIRLHTELEPALWNARIDPTQAEVAILNVVINARDALNNAGRITLRTENIALGDDAAAALGLPRGGGYVSVSVTDNGVGIPPEILGRVMDPFFTTKEEGKGTGLGLSMVYGFAKQSGGAATIESTLHVGTTVRLYFPATGDDAHAATAPQHPGEGGRHERVLIVDDRPEVAEMAALMLRDAGYEAFDCASSAEAMQRLTGAERFDLLLTDLIMPGGHNGVILARYAQTAQPGIKVLLMTGFADGTPDRWGGKHFDMIFKPYSQADLMRKVRQVLDGTSPEA